MTEQSYYEYAKANGCKYAVLKSQTDGQYLHEHFQSATKFYKLFGAAHRFAFKMNALLAPGTQTYTVVELSADIEPEVVASRGIVKWWNDSKGYGFLNVEGLDVFAHYTAIMTDGFKTLTEGEVVTFKLLSGPKGPQAMEIIRENKEVGK